MTAPIRLTDEHFEDLLGTPASRMDDGGNLARLKAEARRARAAEVELRRALEFAHEWMGLEGHECDSSAPDECVVRAALEKI
jgi:hypothetical protein